MAKHCGDPPSARHPPDPGFVQRRSTIGAAAADVPETEAASGGSEGRRWVLLLDPPKSSPMTGIGATPPLAHQT